MTDGAKMFQFLWKQVGTTLSHPLWTHHTNIDRRSCSSARDTSHLGLHVPTAQGADIRRLNCEGFTPLALCAYHGNLELFGHIVKCYQTLIWNYGAMQGSASARVQG